VSDLRASVVRYLLHVAIAAVAVLVAFAALEVTVRVRQHVKYGTARNTVFEMVFDPATGLRIPAPGSSTARIRINSLGFRGPELEVPKPPGRIRLAFLGDSTSFCAEVSSDEATWPHLVWRAVQDANPEVQLDYVNAAVPGYSTEESLRNLKERVTRLQPDVIVIYHGSNDLSFDTRRLATAQGLFNGRAEDSSWLARRSLAWYLVEKNLQLRSRQNAARAETGRLQFEPRALSTPFELRLRNLVAAAQDVAPVVVLGTFSHHARRDQTPEERLEACNTSLYYMPYMSVAGLLAGFEEYNRVIRAVASERGALLVEVAGAVPGTGQYFADSIHFTDAGAAAVARVMAEALLGSDAFRTLVRRSALTGRTGPPEF
jgi:lysophospholipase L1-like esterase